MSHLRFVLILFFLTGCVQSFKCEEGNINCLEKACSQACIPYKVKDGCFTYRGIHWQRGKNFCSEHDCELEALAWVICGKKKDYDIFYNLQTKSYEFHRRNFYE